MLCACFRAAIAIAAPNAILAEPVMDAIATLMFYTAPGRCHKRQTLCNRRLGRRPSKGNSRHQRHQHFEHLLSVPRRPKRSRTSRQGTRRNSRQRRPWAPPVFHARHPSCSRATAVPSWPLVIRLPRATHASLSRDRDTSAQNANHVMETRPRTNIVVVISFNDLVERPRGNMKTSRQPTYKYWKCER